MYQKLHRQAALFIAAIAFAVLACGCASKPVTPDDYIQTSKLQIAAAYKSIGDNKAAGAITTNEGMNQFAAVDRVEQDLRLAEGLKVKGDLSGAQAKAQVALQAITLINAQLKKRAAEGAASAPPK